MEFETHGNGSGLDDLYVLPRSPAEALAIRKFLVSIGRDFKTEIADVKGHAWFGKQFIDIPFSQDLRDRIQQIAEAPKES